MKNKKKYIVGGSLSIMVVSMAVLIWLPTRSDHEQETKTSDMQQSSQQNDQSPNALPPVYTEGPLSKLPTDEQKLAQFIKSRYGKHLDHPSARIEAFEQMATMVLAGIIGYGSVKWWVNQKVYNKIIEKENSQQ